MFRLSTYDACEGIAMVPEYALWQYKRGTWHRIGEESVSAATKATRGKPRSGAIRRLDKIARIRAAELDSDDTE